MLPAYNEEALIEATATALAEVLDRIVDDYEVVVVNDGSRDRTREVVEALASTNPQIRCVSHPTNRGYGEALRTGFSSATKELIFLTDGDKQFDVNELESFLPAAQRADIVAGYRSPRRDSWIRLLYGWGWNFIVNLLFGYTVRDVDCAFKLFRREVWEGVHVHSGGATFSAEFLIRARRLGCRFAELPVSHYPRTAGSPTGAHPRVILRAFRDLLWLRLHLQDSPDPKVYG